MFPRCAFHFVFPCRLSERKAWLVLSDASAKEYGQGAIDFYVAKGLMFKVRVPTVGTSQQGTRNAWHA